MLVWPEILMPEDQRWSPMSGSVVEGGRTFSNKPLVSNWNAGGFWTATYKNVLVYGREAILVAQALEVLLQGGSEPIAIPRRPGPQAPGGGIIEYVPHSDGTPFSDGTLYASGDGRARVAIDAPRNATTLVIDWFGSDPLIGGEDFSVETDAGPMMMRIGMFLASEPITNGTRHTVYVAPPIGQPIAAGAEVNFQDPHCTMRLANAREFAAMLKHNDYGFFDAEFVEA